MARRIDIPDFSPDFSSLQVFISSLNEVAPVVGDFAIGEITQSRLSRLAIARVRDSHYHQFEIPKKSGGTRVITAPGGELKRVLKVLAYVLNYQFFVPAPVMGFVEGCSIATNAAEHTGKSYVLNIDLKDFFPSIRKRMVLSALKRHGIDDEVARLIARLSCHVPEDGGEECLPQGAPTSPILSNFACIHMDVRLSGLAQSLGLTYTRYADDITFSSNHNVFREDGPFWEKLRSIISECGFTLNEKKTRLLRPWDRQEVTGLTVNGKVNVSRRYLKNLRAELHQMQYRDVTMEDWVKVMGKVNYVRMVRRREDADGDDYRTTCLVAYAEAIRHKIRTGSMPGESLMPGLSLYGLTDNGSSMKLAGTIAGYLRNYLKQLGTAPYYPNATLVKLLKGATAENWKEMVRRTTETFEMYADGSPVPDGQMAAALENFANIFPFLGRPFTTGLSPDALYGMECSDFDIPDIPF